MLPNSLTEFFSQNFLPFLTSFLSQFFKVIVADNINKRQDDRFLFC